MMKEVIENKNVLFITTKNLDYIRNTQEINLIKNYSKSYKVIGSMKKSYIKRLIYVYWNILMTSTKKFDTIFIGFSPQLILPGWALKFKKNYLVIDFFISMYDTLVFDRKKFKEKSFIAKLLKWIDTKTLLSADHIICDTKAHGRYFVEEFGADNKKIEALYLEADKTIYCPKEEKRPEKLKDKFIVLYFGSILPLQGIDVILKTIDILKNNKDIFFYVIGPIGDKFSKVASDTVEYIGWLSQEDLAKYINISDLCLAGHFNKDINKAKRTIPGKAYIYEAMNKKMILGDNDATHELYEEGDGIHYFVEMGNAEKLAEKIIYIKNSIEQDDI